MPGPRAIGDGGALQARRWFDSRTIRGGDQRLVATGAERSKSVTVVIPARNEAKTIGAICKVIVDDLIGSIVDELVVIDCDSTDKTAEIASLAGARVESVTKVLPDIPWVLGKGEAMWRGLDSVDTDLVCFIDGDIRNFDKRFVERLIVPLLADESLSFTKGFYRRPLKVDSDLVPAAGGRVTELTARPLLNICYPELAGFLQPLAGEYAARTDLMRSVSFLTGYGVDVGLLIDVSDQAGLQSMAQVDLDERVHRNRPLRELRTMATAIADAILRRAQRDGRLSIPGGLDRPVLLPGADATLDVAILGQEERPPLDDLDTSTRRLATS